jgi:hypothetical protein
MDLQSDIGEAALPMQAIAAHNQSLHKGKQRKGPFNAGNEHESYRPHSEAD